MYGIRVRARDFHFSIVHKRYTNHGHMKPARNTNIQLKSRIYGRISASTPGAVWTVGDFDDFGPRDAVHKVLQRLTREGDLRRVAPGFYDRPRLNRLTGKPSAPNYRAIIEAVARRDHARMLVDGMTAANDLGLSDAVPGRIAIHSDARLKPIHLGNQTIVFRPTAATKLYWAGRPAMRIVQALHWLKTKLDNPDDRRRIQRRLEALLNDPVHGKSIRRDIETGLSALPLWMNDFVQSLPSMKPSPPSRATRKHAKTRRKASKP
jgi:hypothetical protein